MEIKFSIIGRKWKSISIYSKNTERVIRWWGGLKFDCVKINKPITP